MRKQLFAHAGDTAVDRIPAIRTLPLFGVC
jgi:hypothetical protein